MSSLNKIIKKAKLWKTTVKSLKEFEKAGAVKLRHLISNVIMFDFTKWISFMIILMN